MSVSVVFRKGLMVMAVPKGTGWELTGWLLLSASRRVSLRLFGGINCMNCWKSRVTVIVSPEVRLPRLYMGRASSLSVTCRRWSPKIFPVAAGMVKHWRV